MRTEWRWRQVAVAALVYFALAASWAMASPIFAVPDEDAHALKAVAQAHGQVLGEEPAKDGPLVVDLPQGFEYPEEIRCFVARSDLPADCGVELGDPSGSDSFGTWAGRNNPFPYALVMWPSLLLDGNAAEYAMRLVGAALGALLFALAFQVGMSSARSRWMPIGLAFAAAPMCLFLVGAVNPNGLEIVSAVVLWVSIPRLLESHLLEVVERPALPRWYLWLAVAIGSVILLNARALGPIWFALIVAVSWGAVGWRPGLALLADRRSWAWIAPIAAAGVLSVVWTLVVGALAGRTAPIDYPLVGEDFAAGAGYMVAETPGFLRQAMGSFGWLDTVLPPWSYWILAVAYLALVLFACTAARRRDALTVAVALLAAVVLPVIVQASTVSDTGVIWQGRYGLVLYLGGAIMAARALDRQPRADSAVTAWAWTSTAMVAGYGLIAYAVVMRRYVVGDDAPLSAMFLDPVWQPPLGWIGLCILAGASAVSLVVFTVRSSAPRSAEPAVPGGIHSERVDPATDR